MPAAGTAPAPAPDAAAAAGVPAGLTAHDPVSCLADQRVVLDKVYINGKDFAVQVMGQCDVTIKGSTIVSTGPAIVLEGQGTVKIEDSQIEGAPAVVLQGQADLETRGTIYKGGVTKQGQAELEDKGGNTGL